MPLTSQLKLLEDELARIGQEHVRLTLYVGGLSEAAVQAIKEARQFCDTYLKGRYELEVVDVHERPTAVLSGSVLAVPALVRGDRKASKMVVGRMSNATKMAAALDLVIALPPADRRQE